MATNGNETPEPARQPQPQGAQPATGLFGIPAKWLLIGGGGGGGVLVIVIVVVLLLVTGVIGGGGGSSSGGSDVLGYIPGDIGLVLIYDNNSVLSGNAPEDFVDHMMEQGEEDPVGVSPDVFDDLDIDYDDNIALWAGIGAVDSSNISLEIVRGDFDFDLIREELEDGLDCDDDDYRGFELWECPGPEFPAVALFEKDGYVIFAVERQDDLEDMLTYKSRDPDELANSGDSDIKRILDRTDGGWMQAAIMEGCVINRCQGVAVAIGESDDSESIPASYAVMFSSDRVASGAEDDIEIDDLLENVFAGFDLELDIEEVKAENEFVVGTGEAEFVDPDRRGSSNPNRNERAAPATAQPAATEAPAAANPAGGGRRDEWVDDCSEQSARQANQFLARHEQISSSDAYDVCECMYDYFVEWGGPPRVTMGDIMAGRLGADDQGFVDILTDATSYCVG